MITINIGNPAKKTGIQPDASTISAFYSEGFNVGDAASTNSNTNTYVAYCYKAGGNKGTFNIDDKSYASAAAAGLDGGSIDPTGASIGTKQGFSIIKYTADLAEVPNSISHGLTQKPDFAIFKNMDSTLGVNEVDWGVYHQAIGATKCLELNQDLAESDSDGPFNDTEPTSSLFYFGGRSGGSIMGHSYLTNGPAGDDFIGYIWHDVPGLQKFGGYAGNGSATDGVFIELGFRPAVVIIKNVTDEIYIGSRLHSNPGQQAANLSSGIIPGPRRQINFGINYIF